MTSLPTHTEKTLGLVIDLDTCVGCHACVTACKGWNTENYGAALADGSEYRGGYLLDEDDLVAFHEFLAIDPGERAGRVPFIHTVDADRRLQKVAVSGEIVELAEERLRQLEDRVGPDDLDEPGGDEGVGWSHGS